MAYILRDNCNMKGQFQICQEKIKAATLLKQNAAKTIARNANKGEVISLTDLSKAIQFAANIQADEL